MNVASPRASDRASQFVQAALLSPDQIDDVVLVPREKDGKNVEKKPNGPAHAHGDFGHGDFGHGDR